MDRKKICEKLGANQFQKIVFKVEDIKFKAIDKFFPNIDTWYSKRCDRRANKLCLRAKNEEEKKAIRLKYNYKKMLFKREVVEKQNRNYHMTLNNASDFHRYLEWNRKVHRNGMIKNIICMAGSGLLMMMSGGLISALALGYLVYNTICLGVNFECVNLQNYNLCRLEEKREILQRIEERQKEKDIERYSKVGKTIYDKLEANVVIPKSDEVVSAIENIDELLQLRSLALEIKAKRMASNGTIGKIKMKS